MFEKIKDMFSKKDTTDTILSGRFSDTKTIFIDKVELDKNNNFRVGKSNYNVGSDSVIKVDLAKNVKLKDLKRFPIVFHIRDVPQSLIFNKNKIKDNKIPVDTESYQDAIKCGLVKELFSSFQETNAFDTLLKIASIVSALGVVILCAYQFGLIK